MAAILPVLFRRTGASAWSLLLIALTQASFQAWCYNTGSHPAGNPLQAWGIFPLIDSHLYYTAACEILNGQQITSMYGARHPYPLLLAVLLRIFGHDLRAVTFAFTIAMALATWSPFEVIRIRLGGLAAGVYLICVTFYIRIHCTGLLMTEQMALLYSLCAVSILVESVAAEGKAKRWLYCGGLFFVTQALNARPAAYMTLPFLVLASWPLFSGNRREQGKMVILSGAVVAISLLLHSITYHRAVAIQSPSNAWYCIYGTLNGGSWADGRKRSLELLQNSNLAHSDWRQGLRLLRAECLTEISEHPGTFFAGWWRAVQFLWSKNTPFRAADPEMPDVWLHRIRPVVHNPRDCGFAVLLTQNRPPSHEVQSISGIKLAQSGRAAGNGGFASFRTTLGWRDPVAGRDTSLVFSFARLRRGRAVSPHD